MTGQVGKIHRDQLEVGIQKQLPHPVQLEYLQTCASTNTECMQRMPESERQSIVVLTDQQTSGRGRRGKTWHSPDGLNIYCSIGLHKTIDTRYIGLISLQVGVSITEVLRQCGFNSVTLKWPNDLLCDGKKLGGILIETRVIDSHRFYLVIGFGLNVNQDMEQLNDLAQSEIEQPAISLSQLAGQFQNREYLLSLLIPAIIRAIQRLDGSGVTPLLEKFSTYDCLQSKSVMVKTVKQQYIGEYLGITETGEVRVKTDRGVEQFCAAEISLRETSDVTD